VERKTCICYIDRIMSPTIIKGYHPGALGRIAELHGVYYHRHAGFGLFFEAKVTRGLADFLERYNDERDGIWLVLEDGRVEASVVIDGLHAAVEGAHLRWFIASDKLRGSGMGNALLSTAIKFCRSCGYHKIYLDTFEGLQAARHLYEKHGFRQVHQQPGAQWGAQVNEQRFELSLTA
jgi:GNAT superfamily N-acetyltransferase